MAGWRSSSSEAEALADKHGHVGWAPGQAMSDGEHVSIGQLSTRTSTAPGVLRSSADGRIPRVCRGGGVIIRYR